MCFENDESSSLFSGTVVIGSGIKGPFVAFLSISCTGYVLEVEDKSGKYANVRPLCVEFDFYVDMVACFDVIVRFVGDWKKKDSVEGASFQICFGVQRGRENVVD